MDSRTKKKVVVVFPTAWDERQLRACRAAWEGRFEVIFTDPNDHDCPYDFDILGFIESTAEEYRGKIQGVTSSSDYPGATVAGAISTRLGLPGSHPETVIRCSHKYYSRLAQQEAVPEATARFELVDPAKPSQGLQELEFPCFIKPVKGAFSVLARRVTSPEDLKAFLTDPAAAEFIQDYMGLFNKLVRGITSLEIGGGFFLAESLLKGQLVTVEGFAQDQEVQILGIVDSVLHPGKNSFAQFVYPSLLDSDTQERMADIARRVMKHLGLVNTLFNIEMIHDPESGEIHIIEINPRLCGQFADLYQKVDGMSGYEVALALATGERPALRKGAGRYGAAASMPLRVFEPVRVNRAPSEDAIRAAEALYPGTLVWIECEAEQELADFTSFEDGESARYGIINLGADDHAGLKNRFDEVQAALGFEFVPLRQ